MAATTRNIMAVDDRHKQLKKKILMALSGLYLYHASQVGADECGTTSTALHAPP